MLCESKPLVDVATMVWTPFHYPLAYLFHKARNKLSFPALVVGSFLPDLETALWLSLGGGFRRGAVLHSLLGAVTVGLVVAVALTLYLYPPVVSYVFKLDRKTVAGKCHLSASLVMSCLIGIVAHVLVDTLHHNYNPLLFPFSHGSFDALVLFGDWVQATLVMQVIFITSSLVILFYELYRGIDGFWERLFVE